MSKAATPDWREARRSAARERIVDAAWELVREHGLAGLSLRDLAKRAGITTPTVYAYFESKHAIYDAMFERGATDFEVWMTRPYDTEEPHALLVASARRFVEFCMNDVARYQLLFQRTIPGFEPTPAAYAPAVRALEASRARLARAGVTEARQFDLWTALTTGLVDQQISNDPGGHRWARLIDESVRMFLADRRADKPRPQRATKKSTKKGARP